jgi:hypothetical protein
MGKIGLRVYDGVGGGGAGAQSSHEREKCIKYSTCAAGIESPTHITAYDWTDASIYSC